MDGIDLEGLPEEDKVKMMKMIEAAQMRDSLRMYNALVERCFSSCVESFRRKALDKGEEACVRRCAEKFLKSTARVSMRFGELTSGAPTPDD